MPRLTLNIGNSETGRSVDSVGILVYTTKITVMNQITSDAPVETLAEKIAVVSNLLKLGSVDYNGTILTWHPEFQWYCTESNNGFQCYFIHMDALDFNGTSTVISKQ